MPGALACQLSTSSSLKAACSQASVTRRHLQVKLRVELGPADVQQGTCVLATAAATPGALAVKAQRKVSRGRPCVQQL